MNIYDLTFEEINPDTVNSEKFELIESDFIMPRAYLNIGSSPCDEPCAQVGEPDYPQKARKECLVFIEQIRRQLGNEPRGAHLRMRSFPHDFGSYYEVVCEYDDEDRESLDYAFMVEGNSPEKWDETSKDQQKEE